MTRRARSLPALDDRLPLGRFGLTVSPFCLGAAEHARAVCEAFDAGINFFFLSADMHWPLYEGLRRGIGMLLRRGRSMRDRIVVATCSYATQPDFCRLPHWEALNAIPGLGHIDVVIAGGAYRRELAQRVPVYRRHLEERFLGVRAIGCTFHDRALVVPAMKNRTFDVSFLRYNPAHTGARQEVFPRLIRRPRPLLFSFKSTVGWVSPERFAELGLDERYWRPRLTDHYRWVLAQPAVDGILCCLDRPRHVRELADALAAGPLDADELQYIQTLAELGSGKVVLDTGGAPTRARR